MIISSSFYFSLLCLPVCLLPSCFFYCIWFRMQIFFCWKKTMIWTWYFVLLCDYRACHLNFIIFHCIMGIIVSLILPWAPPMSVKKILSYKYSVKLKKTTVNKKIPISVWQVFKMSEIIKMYLNLCIIPF